MNEQTIMQLGRDTLAVTAMLTAPLLLVAVVVGLLVSVVQTITSVQEQTLTFVAKVGAVLITLALLMPWMLQTICQYTTTLLSNLAKLSM
ncbi:MAG: flagellar biosynthetic protein FliQ [Candidatus Brocadiia bacterium]|jgi:flagellar biosynthetic protein FliQ